MRLLAEYTVGDTQPDLVLDLVAGGAAVSLTGALAVILSMTKPSGESVSRAMTIDSTPTTGRVSYTPVADDFDEEGDFACDVRVTGASGTFQHLLRPFTIRVRAEGEEG